MDKIILHAHSEWSHDSKITLENWRIFMKKNSISMVYLTEHEESGWDQNKYEKFNITVLDNLKYSSNKSVDTFLIDFTKLKLEFSSNNDVLLNSSALISIEFEMSIPIYFNL